MNRDIVVMDPEASFDNYSTAVETAERDGSALPSKIRRPGPRRRGRQACVICNKRKIRCILPHDGGPCQNCKDFDYECIPRQRRRKRYSVVNGNSNEALAIVATSETPASAPLPELAAVPVAPGPEVLAQTSSREDIHNASASISGFSPQSQRHKQDYPHSQIETQTPKETAEFVHAALTAQFGLPNHVPLSSTPAAPGVSPAFNRLADVSPGSTSAAYMGRSKYLGEELEEQERSIGPIDLGLSGHAALTADDWAVLHIRKAFDLPPRAVCESLVATFMTRCHPWMPVLETEMVQSLQNGRTDDTPLILVQAVLMAGSRMQTEASSMLERPSTQELYNRAKVLFFSGYERDPMTLLTAVAILQYWNPSGPSHISIHNSGYWLRIGVGLVHQMGLHKEPDAQDPRRALKRRVFWTLFARDSLLSTGQGRPRAIHLEDCSICWPDVSDFAVVDARAHLFVAYVQIAGTLGDLAQWHLRGCPDGASKTALFEQRIKQWIHDLPPELEICDRSGNMRPYDCNTRFLYLPYFTAISLLYKPKLPSGPKGSPQLTLGSTIAASCVARIFEDALARNEVRHGVAMQAIYLLIAGICQLGSYDYPMLWRTSSRELKTISLSLAELSKTWQTAEDTLQILRRLQEKVAATRPNPNPPPLQVQGLDFALFKPFGPSFCSKLPIIINNIVENPTFRDGEDGTGNMDGAAVVSRQAVQDRRTGSADGDNLYAGNSAQQDQDVYGAGLDGAFNVGDQNPLAALLEDIGGDGIFNGENWFLNDLC